MSGVFAFSSHSVHAGYLALASKPIPETASAQMAEVYFVGRPPCAALRLRFYLATRSSQSVGHFCYQEEEEGPVIFVCPEMVPQLQTMIQLCLARLV